MSDPSEAPGTSAVRCGPVVITCMRPEARDLLDRAKAAWERDHPGKDACDVLVSPYRVLYWLFRYSGVITYDEEARP